MRYRKLGRTEIDVGIVGLGGEYLEYASKDTVISVVNEAIDHEVNYIDLFMASPNVRDNFGIALKNKRNKAMIAGHLGAILSYGQYCRSRDKALCEKYFHDLLVRLQTDYIDVLMLHYIDEPDDYETVFGSEGILELAMRVKREGKVRFIGMSSHKVPVALQAVNSGHIDVLMFPINPAFDALSGNVRVKTSKGSAYSQSSNAINRTAPERKELYHACAIHGVGIVAMKPYAAGWLFKKGNPSSIVLTPVQCINYVLSQPGVCTVVPGCRNAEEMKDALVFLDATDKEKDYIAIAENPVWKLRGSCMYCNHCLPCPVGIDIGTTTRVTDTAAYGMTDSIISEYETLSSKASNCTECGVCIENCPFGVDV
ncbi:aldo/keto reductase, partial [Chloroflexota bacterium]